MKIQRKIWNYILIFVLGMMGMITIIFFLVEKLLGDGRCYIPQSAIMIALMLSWTPLDATLIQGVQGRYFIPVLPLIGIAMQNRTIVIRKDISSYLILGAMFFNVYTIYFVALSGISK